MDLLDSSINLLQEFEPLALQSDPRGYCVCSSFGKDSMALIEVFKIAKVKFWVKWNITGIDPPELVYFAREQIKLLNNQNIFTYKQMYTKSMYQMIIDNKMPPTRIIRYCCTELKERTMPINKTCYYSFGVRKAESFSRQSRNELEVITSRIKNKLSIEYTKTIKQLSLEEIYLNNDNHNSRRQFENCIKKGLRAVNPLIYWDDRFLWNFIKSEKVPYCSLYDEGFTRLGCIGCPMAGKKRKMEFKRYPKFYDYYMRAFDKMLDGYTDTKECTWKCAQDVMNWWLEDEKDENQLSLFD